MCQSNNAPVTCYFFNILVLCSLTLLCFMEGDHIPDPLCILVKDLLRIAKAPYNVDPVPETLEEDTNHVQDLEYFPCLPVVRGRGNYCFDTASSLANICTKRSKRHPSLLPGIFLLHCQHGMLSIRCSTTIV